MSKASINAQAALLVLIVVLALAADNTVRADGPQQHQPGVRMT